MRRFPTEMSTLYFCSFASSFRMRTLTEPIPVGSLSLNSLKVVTSRSATGARMDVVEDDAAGGCAARKNVTPRQAAARLIKIFMSVCECAWRRWVQRDLTNIRVDPAERVTR